MLKITSANIQYAVPTISVTYSIFQNKSV